MLYIIHLKMFKSTQMIVCMLSKSDRVTQCGVPMATGVSETAIQRPPLSLQSEEPITQPLSLQRQGVGLCVSVTHIKRGGGGGASP